MRWTRSFCRIFPTKSRRRFEHISLFDENWQPFETDKAKSRIKLNGKTRIVVRAFDRMDGNAERRRLGVFKIGYQILKDDKTPLGEINWTISFSTVCPTTMLPFVYADGSKSGATGETIFNYIASNEVNGEYLRESFFDARNLEIGKLHSACFCGRLFRQSMSCGRLLNFEIRQMIKN